MNEINLFLAQNNNILIIIAITQIIILTMYLLLTKTKRIKEPEKLKTIKFDPISYSKELEEYEKRQDSLKVKSNINSNINNNIVEEEKQEDVEILSVEPEKDILPEPEIQVVEQTMATNLDGLMDNNEIEKSTFNK